VMEYIDGEDLGSFVENQGVLSETEALRYIQQIGSALTVVHDNGLLHRDIKPQNIMLRSGKSEAVLIDFGIAREFSQNLTQTHTQMLADGFAPIEQYDKRAKRGAFTDVYALAATLYSVLTGELPTISPMRAIGTELAEAKKINSSISDK
ncbi:MAG: serine/threonine protein kinase, partial [Dolichospermum sp.]